MLTAALIVTATVLAGHLASLASPRWGGILSAVVVGQGVVLAEILWHAP